MRISFAQEMRLKGIASDMFERGARVEGPGTSKPDARQAEFAAALLDPKRPVPLGWVGPDGKPSTRRFNVYRNNVVVGLTRVLRDAFPATARIVGDEFFAAMARVYIAHEPPRSPLLFDYGVGFPDFIQSFEPVAGLPYLGDVARIERAWVEAYHAPDACSINPAALLQVSPDNLPHLRVVLHPSLRLVRSRFPSLTIWQVNVNNAVPESADLASGGEDVLIVRSDAKVELHALPAGGAEFLRALHDGHSMLKATNAAMAAHEEFDLAVNLAGLLRAEACVDFDVTGQRIPPQTPGVPS